MLKFVLWALAIIVAGGLGVVAVAYIRLSGDMGAEVARLVAAATGPGPVVTETMLAPLPEPARRYFRYAGVVGQPIPRLVELRQKGRIRGSLAENWMALEADETYSTNPPAFVWRASFPSRALPVVLGRDKYLDGEGSIEMKMLGLMTVADEHGPELRAAGLMRYLNETMWFPAALLGGNVTISAIDDASFRVVLSDRGMTAEATYFVDAEGRLTNFRAQRYNTATRSIETWETPVEAYQRIGGLNLPTRGAAVWKLADGDFSYIELDISEVRYSN